MQVMKLAQPYDQAFYDSQMEESLRSARIYIAHLRNYLSPTSVLDVGCGRGMWLKACGELGSSKLVGLDGSWNRQELMAEPAIAFRAIDLDKPFTADPVDLTMCLEVAEHLAPAAAAGFVKSLASTTDAVLFGAAYPGQGGTHHINEQRSSYWARLFDMLGFDAFDLFRPAFWSDSRIPFWYRQNTFLYLRRDSNAHARVAAAGMLPVSPGFMDCVHPDLFAATFTALHESGQALPFLTHVRALTPSFVRAVKRRLKT